MVLTIASPSSLMRGVAAYKFSNQLAIEDQARETIVLDDAAGAALAYGLTPASSRFFFAIQIEAAKEIQRYWFEEWADNRQLPESIPSLQDELRPRLNELGEAIVSTIADTYPITDKSLANQFVRSINVEGLSDSTNYACFELCLKWRNFPTDSTRLLLPASCVSPLQVTMHPFQQFGMTCQPALISGLRGISPGHSGLIYAG